MAITNRMYYAIWSTYPFYGHAVIEMNERPDWLIGPIEIVPEPATIGLLTLGGLVLLRRKIK